MKTGPTHLSLARFLTREHHRVHLLGVAGSGMSGVAALLLELGHQVSGSDKSSSLEVERLQRLGLKFFQQHRSEDAAQAELIVYSSAIRPDNPILVSAGKSETRTARRAEALAAIMQGKRGIRRRPAPIALRRRGNSDSRPECPLGPAGRIFCGRGRRKRWHHSLFSS